MLKKKLKLFETINEWAATTCLNFMGQRNYMHKKKELKCLQILC